MYKSGQAQKASNFDLLPQFEAKPASQKQDCATDIVSGWKKIKGAKVSTAKNRLGSVKDITAILIITVSY